MKHFVLTLLMGLAGPASAQLTGVIDAAEGAVINLHKDNGGLCVDNGHLAEYVNVLKNKTIRGCWTVQRGGQLSIAFLDGDIVVVPIGAVRHPLDS
jgi:hypothetical protein